MGNSYIKKLTTYNLQLTTIMFFSLIGFVQAAPVSSPASLLKKGEWDFTLEGGYLSERPLESSGASDYTASITYGYHSRSYGLTERLMITGRVGGTYGYIYDETIPGAQSETSLSGGLGLGLQLKGIVWQNKDSGLEWDADSQFVCLMSHHKRKGKANADWYEWQLSSCLAKEINRFKPYAGVKLSIVTLDYDDGQGNTTSYDQDGAFSVFGGTDIYFGEEKDIVVNLEAGFLAGNEFSGAVKYKF